MYILYMWFCIATLFANPVSGCKGEEKISNLLFRGQKERAAAYSQHSQDSRVVI